MSTTYPIAFKAKVVKAYRDGSDSQKKIADRFDISPTTVTRWVNDDLIDDFIAESTVEIEVSTTGDGDIGYAPHQNIDLSTGKLKNPRDEDFCRLYIFSRHKHDEVNCFMEAYDEFPGDGNEMGRIIRQARETLARADITFRITNLLKYITVTDQIVDTQLHFMILQNVDFRAKLKAIELYKQDKAKGDSGSREAGYQSAIDLLRGKESK